MPETNGASVDLSAQLAQLTGVVSQLAESQKNITQAIEKMATQPAAAPAAAAAKEEPAAAKGAKGGEAADKPLSLADVARLLDERDAKRTQTAERQGYVETKLKDLPAVYRDKLGGDPSKWAAEEQQIRTQFQADFKAAGGKPGEVSGAAATGSAPQPVLDLSKMSAAQKLSLGLKQLGTPGAPPPATAAAAGGATAAADGAKPGTAAA